MRPPRLLRTFLVAVSVTGAALAWTSPASAVMSSAGSAGHILTSATLQPATNFAVATGCSLLVLGPEADLSWTPTPSAFASGYKVERWRGSTLENTTTVTPRTQSSLTETGLRTGTTYTWRLSAFFQGWTSSVSSVTRSTPGLCL